MMAVDVSQNGAFGLGAPISLFELPRTAEQSDFSSWLWDVTADGKRFLIGKTKMSSEPVTVVLNWSAEFQEVSRHCSKHSEDFSMKCAKGMRQACPLLRGPKIVATTG